MSSLLEGCTVHYFDITGRAEMLRLALAHTGLEWHDDRFPGSEWPTKKAASPTGKAPWVTLADGTSLAQSRAILRLIGKEGGLYPTDALRALRVDELIDTCDDAGATVRSTGDKLEGDAKKAARAESAATGDIRAALRWIDEFVGANGSAGFAVGDSLTIADFALATTATSIASGAFDGVPESVLDGFAHIRAVRKTVASLPSTIAFYEERGNAKSKGELLNAAAKDL
jgi:glutathione S-transferase